MGNNIFTIMKKELKRKSGAFGQLENGSRISRQVSIKLRKSVMKKKLATEKWRISAKKIKVRVLFMGHGEFLYKK